MEIYDLTPKNVRQVQALRYTGNDAELQEMAPGFEGEINQGDFLILNADEWEVIPKGQLTSKFSVIKVEMR